VTAIAVVAGSINTSFAPFYEHIMPFLKKFVMECTADEETRLRGKAFECMSLLGVAVGKKNKKSIPLI
jgi:importin-5